MLGSFYFCNEKSELWKTYKTRIVIFYNDLEIFAQLCKNENIVKNMPNIIKIYEDVYHLIMNKLFNTSNDTSYSFRIEIYNYEKFKRYHSSLLFSH